MLAVLVLLGAAAAVAAKGPAGPGGAGPVLRAIEGTNRADHLVGTARAESITGYRGADRIDGGGGDDDIDGREGDDVISTPDAPGAARLMGGPGDDAILARGPGADTLHGSGGDDRLIAGFGPDALFGGVGDDVLEGGPGYDTLRGGAGDDRLSDGSYGAGLLDGGAGDDAITSSPRGMDLVVCGAGRDAVSADALDIVAPDCWRVVRASPSRGTTTLTQVRSPTGRLLGSTGYPVSPDRARGPYRLLWVHDGLTYLATRFRGSDACFVTVEPSGAGRGECGFGRRGRLFVRRIAGARFRWFALMPAGVRTLAVGGRTIPVRDRIAVFSAGRRPGRIVARGAGPAFAVRVP